MKQKKSVLREFYSNLADNYDAVTLTDEAKWIAPQKVNEYVKEVLTPNMNVLDLGVGTGQSIALPYSQGAKVVGVDLSEQMIVLAKESYPEANFLVADIESDWSFLEDNKFDLIIACGVLEFVEEIEQIFENARRHISSSGYFVFTYEKLLNDDPLQRYKEAELVRGMLEEIPENLSFRVYRHIEEDVKTMLHKHNYEIIKLQDFVAYYKRNGDYPVTYQAILSQAT